MPIYEYRCENCGRINEILVLRKDEELKCGSCGSQSLVKLMSAPNFAVAPGGGFSSGALCGGEASPASCGMTSSCGGGGGG